MPRRTGRPRSARADGGMVTTLEHRWAQVAAAATGRSLPVVAAQSGCAAPRRGLFSALWPMTGTIAPAPQRVRPWREAARTGPRPEGPPRVEPAPDESALEGPR